MRFDVLCERAAAADRARLARRLDRLRGPTAGRGTGTALAVSAPTGQICTVLPEKYDENGSSGYVITSVVPPRSPKSISGSPAISAAKRVQRPHWMQRSRSRSTRSLIGIGFSKWRFSSTKRDSPGPNASVWSWSGHSPPRSHTGQSSGWLMSRNSSTPSCALFTFVALRVDDHAVGDRASRTRSAARACPRPRPGTCGTCRPASCARASRSVGCRCRAPARP